MFDFDFGFNKKVYQCHDTNKIIRFCMEIGLLNKENHSLHFVDPISKVHTNGIESVWRAAKSKIKKMGNNI